MFYSIQALRALAATLVVIVHGGYAYEAWTKASTGVAVDVLPWFNTHLFGASGVHIFFVISGFVISAQRRTHSALDFAVNRIARIVPLYWFLTAYFIATRQPPAPPDWLSIFRSLFFVSVGQPVMAVGWTLNYEMAFYLAFGVIVILLRAPILIVALSILAAALTGSLLPPQPFIAPIMLEFALGIAAFQLHSLPFFQRVGSGLFALGLVALFSSAIWFQPPSQTGWAPTLAWGLPSFLMVLGGTAWETRKPNLLRWAPLTNIGAASYSLYLVHWCLLFGTWNLASLFFTKLPLVPRLEAHIALTLFVVFVILISLLVHRLIELPLNTRAKSLLFSIKGWIRRRPSPPILPPPDDIHR